MTILVFAFQVFNLYAGTLVSYKHYLHHQGITAMLFYNQLKYLITAAKDGTSMILFNTYGGWMVG